MITDYDVYCLRNNVMAMLYRKLYEVFFKEILLIITQTVREVCDISRRKIIELNLVTTFD